MHRLGRFDIPSRLAPAVPAWLSQIACAALSVTVIAVLRRLIDAALPGVAPFALLSPGVLLATALAGWGSGLLTLFLAEILIWRFLLEPTGFDIARPADAGTFILNTLAAILVIAVAEGFRVASRLAIKERSEKLAMRDLLFRELDHRVKNSFFMVTSLVELQRRRAPDPSSQNALGEVAQRIASIARAHSELYHVTDDVKTIDLGAYLRDLCANLAASIFPATSAVVECDCESTPMERDRAVALGLIVNELLTNAAKHAFEGIAAPHVLVSLKPNNAGWRLVVSDNGRGLPNDFAERGGLGRGLIEAFAKQARASLSTRNENGAVFQLDLER